MEDIMEDFIRGIRTMIINQLQLADVKDTAHFQIITIIRHQPEKLHIQGLQVSPGEHRVAPRGLPLTQEDQDQTIAVQIRICQQIPVQARLLRPEEMAQPSVTLLQPDLNIIQ